MTVWNFSSEFDLEEFIWASLSPLLNLQPLARQHSTGGQICDILALAAGGQLVILELKNVEDRYVVPQLTRYCASLSQEQPFADRVDYSLPIRLIAIAPTFHAHNYVDREHSRLEFEFWRFEVIGAEAEQAFHLKSLDTDAIHTNDIPPLYQQTLQKVAEAEAAPEPIRPIGRPPKSFRLLQDELDPDKQEYLLALRRKILEFDDQMAEVGLTKRTQYGYQRGKKGIPSNRICAEFLAIKINSFHIVNLHLMLPYPKGGLQKLRGLEPVYGVGYGLARVPLFKERWENEPTVDFFLGKSREVPSFGYTFNMKLYQHLCGKLLNNEVSLATTADLIDLALQEWRAKLQS